jgi:hypothetical protein
VIYTYNQVLLRYVIKFTVNSGLERMGRKRSLRNLRHCRSIGLEGLRKVTKTVSEVYPYLGRYSNVTSSEFKSEALSLEPGWPRDARK